MRGKQTKLSKHAPLSFCDKKLPWVESAVHPGHVLHQSGTMEADIKAKRAEYIGKFVDISDTFKFASPVEVLLVTDIYCSSYNGIMAGWDLSGNGYIANSFFNSWVVNVMLAWNVPRQTRTCLLQNVLADGFTSAKTEILTQYVGFYRSLCWDSSHEVKTAALLNINRERPSNCHWEKSPSCQ